MTTTSPILPQSTRAALKRAHRAEEERRPTRLAAAALRELRVAGLAYTIGDGTGRRWVHLTARGRKALGLEPGIRR